MTSSNTSLPFKKVKLRQPGGKGTPVSAGQGHVPDFYPGGMPAPTWCAVINPCGDINPPEMDDTSLSFRTQDLSYYFEPYNVDATLILVKNVTIETACQNLWKAAKKDARDHETCMNGGAYAVWDVGDGHLLLGGFDNCGSDIAAGGVFHEASTWSHVVSTYAKAHFEVEALMMDPDEEHPVSPGTSVPPCLQDVLKAVSWEKPLSSGPRF